MSQNDTPATAISRVSVVEIVGEKRQIRAGKVDREGTELAISTPNNDIEGIERRAWERVDVFQLPREMPKSEFKQWWNDHKDDNPRPAVIHDVLSCIEGTEAPA